MPADPLLTARALPDGRDAGPWAGDDPPTPPRSPSRPGSRPGGPVPSSLLDDPGWEIETSPGLPRSLGRYRDLSLVAVGGQGRVYRAWDTLLDRAVALKFLRWDSPGHREDLLKEGRALAQLAHPGICPVHEVGELGGEPFLALAWVEGPPLREALPGLPPAARLGLLLQACEALQAAHARGLVHLDLKPANLLLEPAGRGFRVRVTDFGLAGRTGDAFQGRAGTPPYASPEQFQGGSHVLGPACDVYALGVLLHLVLTGRLPHEAGRDRLRGDAARLFARATALDPARRHADAGALAEDLRALAEGRPLPGLRTSPWHRVRLWTRRHRAAAGLLAAALALAALGTAQILRLRLDARAQAEVARRFGQDVRGLESSLRLSHLSPPHDLGPVTARVRAEMERIRLALRDLGPEAQAEGWFALGRAHQLLGEDPEALAHLERAWALGLRSPDCAQALGLARADAYLDALRDQGVDLQRAPGHPATAGLRQTYALPAVDLLARASRDRPDVTRALDAVRMDLEGRAEEADRLASDALLAPPAHPVDVLPWRILAQYWEYRAQVLIGREDPEAARLPLARAWSALDRAAAAARSDPALRLSEGWLSFTEAHRQELAGDLDGAQASLDRARDAFAAARRLQPDLRLAAKFELDALRRRVTFRRLHERPSGRALAEALAALEAAPKDDPGLQVMVRRLLHEALRVSWSAGEPVDGPALWRYEAALVEGTGPGTERALALLRLECAEERLRRRQDPGADLAAARAPLEAAYRQAPEAVGTLEPWADLRLAEARAAMRAGRGADLASLEPVAAALEASIRRDGAFASRTRRLRALRALLPRAPRLRPVPAPAAPGP